MNLDLQALLAVAPIALAAVLLVGLRLPARLATDALLRELATHGRSPRERLGDLCTFTVEGVVGATLTGQAQRLV